MDRYPSFFLPQGSSDLEKDTWILLEEFYELEAEALLNKVLKNEIF